MKLIPSKMQRNFDEVLILDEKSATTHTNGILGADFEGKIENLQNF